MRKNSCKKIVLTFSKNRERKKEREREKNRFRIRQVISEIFAHSGTPFVLVLELKPSLCVDKIISRDASFYAPIYGTAAL